MTQPRSPFIALLLGLVAGGWLAACAAKSPAQRSAEPSAMGDLEHRGTGHDPDIEALDKQIARDLDTLGMNPPTDHEIGELMAGGDAVPMPMGVEASSTCEQPPAADGCGDVCTVATSICGNAKRICELAADLEGDDWATQRCVSGKSSCERATARCCDC